MHRIEVGFSDKSLDSTAKAALCDIKEDLGVKNIREARYSEIYEFEADFSPEKLSEIAEKVLTDPLVQEYSIDGQLYPKYKYFVEVKVHPDVTDNTGLVAQEAVSDFLGKKTGKVRAAKRYYFSGSAKLAGIEKVARQLLANEIIETFTVGEAKTMKSEVKASRHTTQKNPDKINAGIGPERNSAKTKSERKEKQPAKVPK